MTIRRPVTNQLRLAAAGLFCLCWAFDLLFMPPAQVRGQSFESMRASNWHQWRGPEANGVSRTATPPVEWSEDKNVHWKVEIDEDGRVYITGRNGAALVLERTGEMDVRATNDLDDRMDASPALAGNQLFLRGKDLLDCIAE